jgi:hypothetical protein
VGLISKGNDAPNEKLAHFDSFMPLSGTEHAVACVLPYRLKAPQNSGEFGSEQFLAMAIGD